MLSGKAAHAFCAGMIVTGSAALATPAAAPTLAALARIEAGQWQFRSLDAQGPTRSFCIGDARMLIQYGHNDLQCEQAVVTNDADEATVHYTCPGIGHGVTTFKVATPRNFNLETQGIVKGAPFEEQYEARRIGACPHGAAVLR